MTNREVSNQSVIDALSPVLQRLEELDLSEPGAVKEILDREFPLDAAFGSRLREIAQAGIEEGWLCDREMGDSRFSRVARPDAARGYSIDAVMLWGDGPWHKHTNGEVNCLLNWEGDPTFCGFRQGWAVFEPASQHVPSVKDGKMMIFYMLPDGAVEWKQT